MRAAAGFVTALVLAPAALAQEPNTYLGKVYSQELCASCHALGAGETESPHPKAPAFQKIADTPGMTAIALSAWMYSMHPSMPNIVLKSEHGEHVFAYILSLRTPAQ